jgi:hypothetical protein
MQLQWIGCMFCPECKTMLIPSKGQLKCRKCGYIRKIQTDNLPKKDLSDFRFCFCNIYRCPHRDYSLCPKDCEKLGPMSRCMVKCQLANPEECDKIMIKLQEEAGERPEYIDKYSIPKTEFKG